MSETAKMNDVEAAKPQETFVEGPLTLAYRKFSYFWSTLLLIFALVVTYWDIAKGWTNDFDDEPTYSSAGTVALNIILFTVLMFWVAILEGAQGSIVGLSSVDIESFKDTHKQAYAVCKLCHKGTNLERFIIGRQFILLFVVFVISRLGSHNQLAFDGNRQNFHMGDWEWARRAELVFIQNSILLMIVIIIPGQLVAQLVSTGKMLSFLELGFAPMYTVALPSLGMEALGLTHCAYGIRDIMVSFSSEKMDPSTIMKKTMFYYIKLFYSTVLVIFGLVCVVYGLLDKQTNATNGPGWEDLPGYAALLLTLFFGFFIGCCEGFQIAAFKLKNLDLEPVEFQKKYPAAFRVTELLLRGRNLKAFMVGRQVFVAMMMVLLGRVTGFSRGCPDFDDKDGTEVHSTDGNADNNCIFGFPEWFMKGFLQSGIIGAIVVVNIFQLSFRMAATCFPVIFINNNVMYLLLRVALLVEGTGIVNACWPLAWGLQWLFGIPDDPDMPTLQQSEDAKASVNAAAATPAGSIQNDDTYHITAV